MIICPAFPISFMVRESKMDPSKINRIANNHLMKEAPFEKYIAFDFCSCLLNRLPKKMIIVVILMQ
jgi:hypothetical protein